MGYPGRHNIYEATIRRMVLAALEAQELRFRQEHEMDTDEELLDLLRHQLKIVARLWLVTTGLLALAVLFLVLQWKYGFFMPF